MSPSVDIAMARTFIKELTGAADSVVTLQLFPEAAGAARGREAIHHHCLTHERFASWLEPENLECGVGVFVMVNGGDLKGRSARNVTTIRALFIDDDKGLLPPDSPQLAALPPTLTVRTRKGWHHYWVLVPGEALSTFTSAQATLAAHFGTDPAVKDLPRVMRVPGFLHMKDPSNPVLVKLVHAGSDRYTISDVLQAYPAPTGFSASRVLPVTHRVSRRKQGVHTTPTSPAEAKALLEEELRHPLVRWMQEEPDAVDRETWRGVGQNLACAVLDHPDLLERARQAFHELSEDYSSYRFSECEKTFHDAVKSARQLGPMTFQHMAASGMPEEHWSAGTTSLIHAARLRLRARQGGAR